MLHKILKSPIALFFAGAVCFALAILFKEPRRLTIRRRA